MAAEEVKGMERMPGGRKRQKREVKETRVDRWMSLPHRQTERQIDRQTVKGILLRESSRVSC